MTKAELVAEIADKTGLNRSQAKEALEAFVGCVTDSLRKGEEVRLVGFGSFVPISKPAGMTRNPRTGQQVARAASKTVKFRAGESLKGAME